MLAASPTKISNIIPTLSYPSQIQTITIARRLDGKFDVITLNH